VPNGPFQTGLYALKAPAGDGIQFGQRVERSRVMCNKILVTVDGSHASEAILPAALRAAAPGGEVILLTVSEVPPAVIRGMGPLMSGGAAGGTAQLAVRAPVETRDQAMSQIREREEQYLHQLAEPLVAAGASVKTQVAFGDAVEEILSAAGEEDVDVIMMSSHGRTGLAAVLFGSVASRVFREAGRPVTLVRPEGLKE
jgi:nucleotide-binding universal stress UspA family protein